MTTYVHKLKCMACSLHFVVYSWYEDWEPLGGCPECSSHGPFIRWRDSTTEMVAQHVPGSSELVSVFGQAVPSFDPREESPDG